MSEDMIRHSMVLTKSSLCCRWSLVVSLIYNIVLINLPKLEDKLMPRKLFGFSFSIDLRIEKIDSSIQEFG